MYPELFRIPFLGWPISSFGAALAVAFLVGYAMSVRRMEEERIDANQGANLLLWIMIGGVVGSKLYFAVDNSLRGEADFFAALFSRAGMTFYGGLMGGALAAILGCLFHRIPVRPFANAVAPALAAGQAIGRIGCFLVGDDYGRPTEAPWGIAFPKGLPPTDEAVHPTQLYEFGWLTLAAIFLWSRRRKSPSLIGEYLMLNGVGRTVIEHWRVNPRVALGLSEAQWIGVALVVFGLVLWLEAWSTRTMQPESGS